MAVSDRIKRLSGQADEDVARKREKLGNAVADMGAIANPVESARPLRTIASYSSYADAERAVDWLSDQGFAVRQGAIVGTGLRSVEQVTGRMTSGRAALIGAGQGALIAALFALLFGIFFTSPDFGGLLLYALLVGGLFGALFGALAHYAASGGRRDFVSATDIRADRYEVQVKDDAAEEAQQLIHAMPRTR